MEEFLINEFYEKMDGVNFEAYGILGSDDRIHTLGTDSKIIGRIFEMYTQPVLSEIAKAHGMQLKTPASQTVYPDFIMMRDEGAGEKIAIDVKTTYVTGDQSIIKFTLGSYGSYMRNNTKNIEYRYTDYAKHYVIGFVYKRNGGAQESAVYDYSRRGQIVFPYHDVRYFIQEKYKIAGDRPGSGNTENIGSFPTRSFSELREGRGPFSQLGADVFDLYWKYYPKYRSPQKDYTTLDGFLEWVFRQEGLSLLHPYDHRALLRRIQGWQAGRGQ